MPAVATPVLDQFTRANAVLNTGNWAAAIGLTAMSIVSNAAKSTSSVQASYWTTPFGVDQEVYYTVTTKAQGTWLNLRLSSPGSGSFNGYQASHDSATTGLWHIWKVVAGTQTEIAVAGAGDTIANGDVFSFRAVGATLTVSRNGVDKLTVDDTTYLTGGYIAMEVETTTHVLDNFGGGQLGRPDLVTPTGLS